MPSRILRSVIVAAACAAGCAKPKFPAVTGHTDIRVTKVEIEAPPGEHLVLDYEELLQFMGLRAKDPIRPERTYNPYRLAEDRRRIVAYAQMRGHFDVTVAEPELAWGADKKTVAVTWHVHEGAAYHVASVTLKGVPPEYEATLRDMLHFGPGDEVNLEEQRPLRRALAERLQDEGFGHARGYYRGFVDRDAKTIAMYYYFDPGPKTRIGAIHVEGNKRVPVDMILERAGLAQGKPYSTTAKRRAETALLDTGAFASAVVVSDADIQTGPPEFPETGGVLAPEQVSADGELVPRKLPDEVGLRVVVVEAPAQQIRAEVGIEADRARLDTYAGTRVTMRNLFGPQHHLVLEGNVGYGYLFDDSELAGGVYGSALAQYIHPVGHDYEMRATVRWRDTLYPSAMLREVVAGPGVRGTVAPGVFLDLDAFYRFGRTLDLPAIDAMPELAFTSEDSRGVELVASAIADHRDDRVEPTDGWMLGLRGSYSPGGPLGDHRWLQVIADARAYRPVKGAWSFGARVSSGWVLFPGDEGVPLGPRLFGGGAYGMRGFGRDHLSPGACPTSTISGACDVLVGGRSLVEASAEMRFLPFRKQFGLAGFLDAGAAGAGTNAFADGISLALGVGARLRLWYVPISLDVAYRFMDGNELAFDGGFDRLSVLFRVGEAF